MEPEMEPVTEASNFISSDIDLADSQGIVNLLQQCDSQIFSGWKLYPSLYHCNVIDTIDKVSERAVDVLKSDTGCVILSGCGTSGRLAFITARAFNSLLLNEKFRYTIAGGDRALVLSTEAPEDSWTAGVNDLETASKNMTQVLYIGITCGLSAPYVAGQLYYCMQHLDKYIPVLMGFNPIELARNLPIANWDKTFYDIASAMSINDKCYIINPVVGPEPITGSSRMKSGTATKILLETIFMTSVNKLEGSQCSIVNIFACYEMTYRFTYLNARPIADLLLAAGKSLCSSGRVCYIGQDRLGIMGIIDSSECPPTYGASLNDVRGFIDGGWNTLNNKEGNLALKGPKFDLDTSYFESHVLPQLSGKDTVIFVRYNQTKNRELIEQVKKKECIIGTVSVTNSNTEEKETGSINVAISLPYGIMKSLLPGTSSLSNVNEFFNEISVKLVLNAISTGAHIAKGKVLGNRMIDLQVSNNKLYYRSLGIIQEFAQVDKETAEKYLLMSIYDQSVSPSSEDITKHITAATGVPLVVPTAILMIKRKASVTEARSWLIKQPVLRKALTTCNHV